MDYRLNMRWLVVIMVLTYSQIAVSQGPEEINGKLGIVVSKDLIKRVIPTYADSFEVEYAGQEEGKDVFELESIGDKTVKGSGMV